MLYIFCVETTKSSKSDEKYIRAFINNNYEFLGDKVKFVYMGTKTKYDDGSVKSEVKRWEERYLGESKKFICIDIDNCIADKNINDKISDYCAKNGYELIWFYEDIERVFVGEKISDKAKTLRADKFYAYDEITKMDLSKFEKRELNETIRNTSNIKHILDKYFKKKI